ncbi:MAG: glycosyltransferase family 9 protein [Vicinamibacterales bacterium]
MSGFLIVRLGALGDIVHAVPVAAALRRAFPDARIDWVVAAKHAGLLALLSGLSGRIVLRPSSTGEGLSITAALRTIRRAKYDVVLDLQGLIKSAVIARGSGAPRVIGFASAYLREPLAGVFYTEQHDPSGDGMLASTERRHVVTINLGLLDRLGVPPAAPEFPFAVPASRVADDMREATGGRFALLNPGAAWPNKRWPAERLALLATRLFARHRLRSVVLWGPGERDLAETIVAQSGGAAVMTPDTTFGDIMALARCADVMVSGDTGPTHIAAAIGVPIVGIYGPTRPERNGPWNSDDVTVSRAAACQCHHRRRCRATRWCLLDIEVEEVLSAVEQRLAKGGASHVG